MDLAWVEINSVFYKIPVLKHFNVMVYLLFNIPTCQRLKVGPLRRILLIYRRGKKPFEVAKLSYFMPMLRSMLSREGAYYVLTRRLLVFADGCGDPVVPTLSVQLFCRH